MHSDNTIPQEVLQCYQSTEVIFSQNMPGQEMFIVYSGRVDLYSQTPSGESKLLRIIRAGDFFGEMALVDESPRSATAIAGEDNTRLLVLDKSKFLYLLRNQPDFALVVMGKLCRQLRDATTTQGEA